ncbi:hypothetical protein Tsubulata_005846, partial [Turnera subulata]
FLARLQNFSKMDLTSWQARKQGYIIPKGWRIYVYLREINYDPSLYPESFTFNPWRWLKTMQNFIRCKRNIIRSYILSLKHKNCMKKTVHMKISEMDGRKKEWSLASTASFLEEEAGYAQERNWELLKLVCSFTILSHNTGGCNIVFIWEEIGEIRMLKFPRVEAQNGFHIR